MKFWWILLGGISVVLVLIAREVGTLVPTFQLQTPSRVLAEQAELYTVERVVDGDTIKLTNGQTVRYIGMDTPETKKPGTPLQCFGEAAAKRNSELVTGKQVRLEKDVSETDRYGRLLRYVYVGDTLINEQLVREGFARVYSYPPDVAKQAVLSAAEVSARTGNQGMWRACP